jgi:regulatory protein
MEDSVPEKYWKKICGYCSYRERSPKEAREKLQSYEIGEELVNELLEKLENENFLDSQRFAEAFSRGKFNSRSWGKIKIATSLRSKGIDQTQIAMALSSIEKSEYWDKAVHLAEKKVKDLGKQSRKNQAKLIRYLASKGYEFDLIYKVIEEIRP